MSDFTDSMNFANLEFGAVCGETFTIPNDARIGKAGSYTAISIDNLQTAGKVIAGGKSAENTVHVWVTDTTIAAAGIKLSAILVVRGDRVRVTGIEKDGDNTFMLGCDPASISL